MNNRDFIGKEISLQDDRILSYAWGHSAEELGAHVGMAPERAIARAKYLLRQRDVWTAIEQEDFLFREMLQQLDRIKVLIDGGMVNEKYLAVMNATLKMIGTQLDRMRKRTAEEMDQLNDVQARAIRDVVENAFYHAVKQYEIENQGVDLDDLRAKFAKSLVLYAAEHDAEVQDADGEVIIAELMEKPENA